MAKIDVDDIIHEFSKEFDTVGVIWSVVNQRFLSAERGAITCYTKKLDENLDGWLRAKEHFAQSNVKSCDRINKLEQTILELKYQLELAKPVAKVFHKIYHEHGIEKMLYKVIIPSTSQTESLWLEKLVDVKAFVDDHGYRVVSL